MIFTCTPSRVRIYVNTARKTAEQIKAETGCTAIINGGLYTMSSFTPVCHLKVDGQVLAVDQYKYWGYGWTDGIPKLVQNYGGLDNFIGCVCLVRDGRPESELFYSAAVGGARARTAFGTFADGRVWMYASQTLMTPEQLRDLAVKSGVLDAIMLDGGGSTQGIFPDGEVKSGRIVQNYICVWDEAENTPKKEDTPMKIYLSPSSQSANLYAAGNTNEQVQCNRIAAAAKTALERCGFEVKKAKEGQSYQANVAESNSWGADIHVPIHTNAGGGHGPLVLVYSRTTARLALAQPVYDALNAVVPTASKYGVQVKPGLYEVSNSKGKCVYIECAFHDDKSEAQWIIDNVTLLGEEIARGLCKGTGVKYVEPASASAPVKPESPSAYAAASCGKAVVRGIFKGDGQGNYGWKEPVTRQDLCVVLDRLGLL